MTTQELEQTKEKYTERKKLLDYLNKCKRQVILYTRLNEAAEELSNRQEWTKKKLHEWLKKLDKAKQRFKDF
jgi:uncharacterized protein